MERYVGPKCALALAILWPASDWRCLAQEEKGTSDLHRYIQENSDPGSPALPDPNMLQLLRQEAQKEWDKFLDYKKNKEKGRKTQEEDLKGQKGATETVHLSDERSFNVTFPPQLTWVLVRHEWQAYRQSQGILGRRAAAWRLHLAVNKLVELTSEGGVLIEDAQRVFLARNYLEGIARTDETHERYTEERLRYLAREEIVRLVSPASTADVNKNLQNSIRETFEAAGQSLVKAEIGYHRAGEVLTTLYGASKPDREKALANLSDMERKKFQLGPEVDKLISEYNRHLDRFRGNKGDDKAELGLSVVQQYANLRKSLGTGNKAFASFDNNNSKWKAYFAAGVGSDWMRLRAPDPINRFFAGNNKDEAVRREILLQLSGLGEKYGKLENGLKYLPYLEEHGISEEIKQFLEKRAGEKDLNNELIMRIRLIQGKLDKVLPKNGELQEDELLKRTRELVTVGTDKEKKP